MKKIIALVLVLSLAAALLCGCAKKDEADKTIVVGASAVPHAVILEQIQDAVAEQGYTLEIKIFDDYVTPNTALNEGELDANYFQHVAYLHQFNKENGTELSSAALVHYEPFGIYGNGVDSLDQIGEGTTVIIPADGSNETRALFLLAQEGLITLPEGADAEVGVTVYDIIDDGGLEIEPVNAETVSAQLANSDAGTIAIINGNYALQAGLDINDALAVESTAGDAAQIYANIIAVRTGDEESEKTKVLLDALLTEDVAKYIEETYTGAVVPMF